MPRVLIASLGGTITMTRSAAGGIVPTLTAADLVAAIPEIASVAEIVTVSPLQKPGASLTLVDLLRIAPLLEDRLRDDFDGAVVIQGTDTIEETAFLLDRMIASAKTVVVTGAMRGPQEAGADGPRNVLSAATVAAAPGARGRGALVVMNDEIHAARSVMKTHTALPSAFHSAAPGVIGLVCEGVAHFHAAMPRAPLLPMTANPADAAVALVKIALDDDGRLLAALPSLGFSGVVIEAMGAGHVPSQIAPIIEEVARTMPVILTSRAGAGRTFEKSYGFVGSETDLIRRGAIPAGAFSGLKARLLLIMLLRAHSSRQAIYEAFAA